MQPAIKDYYRLTSILLSSEQQDIVLCRKSSSATNSLQKYIINIYKNKNTIRNILPDLSDFESKYAGQYIEHYIKGSHLHIVLRHSIPADCITVGKGMPIKDRTEMANNLFIRVLELNELKPVHLYSLLSPDNIVIGIDKRVYINNILTFPENAGQITNRDIAKRLGIILLKIFTGPKKLPKPLVHFIHDCCNGSFDSAAQAYTAFKSIKSKLDEADYDFKKGKKLFGIILIPFDFGAGAKAAKASILKKSVIPFIILLFVLSCSGLFIYDRYFKKDVPAASEENIQIAEPTQTVSTVYEEKQPEPPAVQTYTVQTGDSLSYISKKFYNDPSKYQIIADYNRLPDPNNLAVGQVLQIP